MEKSLFVLLYVFEIFKYYLAYEVFFGERLRRYIVPLLGLLVYLVALFALWNTDRSFLAVLAYFIVFCTITVVQNTTLLGRIQRTLILLFTITCADAFFNNLLKSVFHLKDMRPGIDSLPESFVTLLVVVVLYVVNRRNKAFKIKWSSQKLTKPFMVIMLLMAIEIVMTTTCLEGANAYIDNPRFHAVITIICPLSYLGIEMLGIFILYIKRVNAEMEQLVEDELLLQEMQKRYYESLLEKEENTRRYRHDMANHLLCLNRFAEERDLAPLQEYLLKMRQELQEIQKNNYESGNRIIDIITNHYIEALPSYTEVKITGRVQIHMDDMKLCTVYGNLLQNAIEEIRCCQDKALLDIRFEQGTQFCKISIRNSLSKTSLQKSKNQLLKSKKSDRRDHGLGLSNAARAAEALNGILELKKEENYFLAVLILPL